MDGRKSLRRDYDVGDVRQLKAALNHLGYYTPDSYAGMADERDPKMFVALKEFQQDHSLPQSDYLIPHDETMRKLNDEMKGIDPRERYIWRTYADDRVRDEHASREGQVFTWGFPPPGGHPGSDYNCRCWAEPIKEPKGLKQEVISPINDAENAWDDADLTRHFFLGNGEEKTLEEIGLLDAVINHAKQTIFNKVEEQISKTVRQIQEGQFY